jgi:DNA invertase Pin-like site-specific DNA recombinase
MGFKEGTGQQSATTKGRESMTRCALYGRISTRDKGQEVENQLVQLRDFAVRQGWEIVSEFTDSESGSKSDRPQFQEMFKAASQRKFDVLLFWSLDRLSREGVLETLQHLNRLTSYGVNYRSFTEQYFDSCGIFKDAVISILATVAKQERIRISERVRAGLATAKARGVRLGRRAKVRPDAGQIRLMREAGKSFDEICEATGVSRGAAWRAAQV